MNVTGIPFSSYFNNYFFNHNLSKMFVKIKFNCTALCNLLHSENGLIMADNHLNNNNNIRNAAFNDGNQTNNGLLLLLLSLSTNSCVIVFTFT